MKQCDPYSIFEGANNLEQFPCSILALGLALKDMGVPVTGELGVTVDEKGYCQLANMGVAIRNHLQVKKYHYYRRDEQKPLKDYTCFPGKYIVCVRGHYIYIKGEEYYSFYDNSEDQVIAYWLLKEEKHD